LRLNGLVGNDCPASTYCLFGFCKGDITRRDCAVVIFDLCQPNSIGGCLALYGAVPVTSRSLQSVRHYTIP